MKDFVQKVIEFDTELSDALVDEQWSWKTYHSAPTLDRTQRKRLDVRVGAEEYRVVRRHISDDGFISKSWDEVYRGRDRHAAVTAYLRLS